MATLAVGGSLTAASPLFAFQTKDAGIVGVEVSGTWTGTITFEARIGNTWANAQVFTVASAAAAATTTANVSRLINAAGFSEVRANFSTPTSGSPTVIFTGSPESMGGSAGGGGGGAATIADGADVAEGTTTDAAITTNIAGTLIGFARGNIVQWAAFLARLPAALISGRLDVNLGAAPATVTITGLVAHDAVDSGNPTKTGFRAIAHGTNPTAVSAADRSDWLGNVAGVPFVIGGHPNVQSFAQNYTSAQTNAAVITVAAGTKIVVTGFLITAANSNTVDVSARLGFGTASTPAYGAAQLIGTHPGIAPGSGFGRGGGSGILGIGADDEDVRITCSVPTGGSVDCAVSYYTVPT